MPVPTLGIQGGRGRSKWFQWHFGNVYGWHVSKWMGVGVWDGWEREVLSSHIGATGLVCFVLSCQFKKLVTGWFKSLMLLELVQLLSIWKNYKGHQTQSKAACVCECVWCVCVCVCAINALIKYLWPNHGSFISQQTCRQTYTELQRKIWKINEATHHLLALCCTRTQFLPSFLTHLQVSVIIFVTLVSF